MHEQQISNDRESLNRKNESIRERELLTEQEAADFLRISKVSLWRARKRGLLTFRRVMGKILYTKTDLLDFLENSKHGGYAVQK